MATDTISATTGEPPVSFLGVLARMGAGERLAAYRAGGFTLHERNLWAARFPDEPPLVNGEFEWIALSLADLDWRRARAGR